MLRATREFIRDRQGHTDFVVGTMTVRPYERPVIRHEIMDAVSAEVRRNAKWQAVMGWRVYDYDALRDETRFEPWWWIIDEDHQAWDVTPDPAVREYIMDQALIIYRREAFEQHQPIRPPDLYLHAGAWEFAVGDHRHRIESLDRDNLTRYQRDNSIQVTIVA